MCTFPTGQSRETLMMKKLLWMQIQSPVNDIMQERTKKMANPRRKKTKSERAMHKNKKAHKGGKIQDYLRDMYGAKVKY